MIEAKCITNLDEYLFEEWPKKFVAVPRVGEMVAAESGKILKVVRVTHRIHSHLLPDRPYIEIELSR